MAVDTAGAVLTERDGAVLVLTMNRPEARNALSPEMLAIMRDAWDRVDSDDSIRVCILTGAGGAFCAGGDVKAMDAGTSQVPGSGGRGIDAAIHAQRLAQRSTAGRIYQMPKPVIASLPGAAAGAGFSLALACDLRVAADNAVLLTSFARVGFSGDWGGTFFLTQIVGSARARELYYLSERIDASEALRIGLVNRVVPAAELEKQTRELALRIASGPTVAYRYMKENLNRAASGAGVLECLDLEATHHVHTGQTEDHKEAARAFVEKRTPVFRGR